MPDGIVDPLIESYIEGLVPAGDRFLRAMEERAERDGFPIIGPAVGALIGMLTRLKDPALVVELGSGFGYSAYWFARNLTLGRIILTDRDPKKLADAETIFREAGLWERAVFIPGDALETARKIKHIEILFMDLDKSAYLPAIRTMKPNLAPGALVIADNVLWHRRVVGDASDPDTEGIRAFNKAMSEDADFTCSFLPLRDGVLVAQLK